MMRPGAERAVGVERWAVKTEKLDVRLYPFSFAPLMGTLPRHTEFGAVGRRRGMATERGTALQFRWQPKEGWLQIEFARGWRDTSENSVDIGWVFASPTTVVQTVQAPSAPESGRDDAVSGAHVDADSHAEWYTRCDEWYTRRCRLTHRPDSGADGTHAIMTTVANPVVHTAADALQLQATSEGGYQVGMCVDDVDGDELSPSEWGADVQHPACSAATGLEEQVAVVAGTYLHEAHHHPTHDTDVELLAQETVTQTVFAAFGCPAFFKGTLKRAVRIASARLPPLCQLLAKCPPP